MDPPYHELQMDDDDDDDATTTATATVYVPRAFPLPPGGAQLRRVRRAERHRHAHGEHRSRR
jgi:hypothetical protein